jgi:hypothetical protein
MFIFAFDVISPVITISPFPATVSHATLEYGSCDKQASNTLSDIKSHSLSGCPSVTLSLVNNFFIFSSLKNKKTNLRISVQYKKETLT